jgi:hypothetical protein
MNKSTIVRIILSVAWVAQLTYQHGFSIGAAFGLMFISVELLTGLAKDIRETQVKIAQDIRAVHWEMLERNDKSVQWEVVDKK